MSNGAPRRISIFGGLLWIIIGGLLLANNLIANFGVWHLFERFWPVLFILLGIAKLYDHFMTRQSGEAPARLLTGGEIFLLIMMFVIGGTIAGISRVRGGNPDIDIHFPWDRDYTYTEEVTHAVKPNMPISIWSGRGDIQVHPAETDQIRVVVNKVLRESEEAGAIERAKTFRVVINESASGYEVRTESTGNRGYGNARMDLDVFVPKKANVEAKTAGGAILVMGVDGNVTANTRGGSGNLEIRDVTGNVEADVEGGDVRIINAKGDTKINGRCGEIEVENVGGLASIRCSFTGGARIKNIGKELYFKSVRTEMTAGKLPGRVEIGSGTLEVFDVPANFSLHTSNYDVTLENITGRVIVENRNGGVTLRLPQPPKEDVEISNQKGEIQLVMPEKSAFEISASTRRGEVESEFKDLKVTEDDKLSTIEGSVGVRGPQVRLKTTFGAVRLRKGN